jgi:hypothetical protein
MAQIFDIGNRYVQREETVHLAVELIDRLFLGGSEKAIDLLQTVFVRPLRTPCRDEEEEDELNLIFEMTRIRYLSLYTVTCFIIAAKYDELDENIPLISDL